MNLRIGVPLALLLLVDKLAQGLPLAAEVDACMVEVEGEDDSSSTASSTSSSAATAASSTVSPSAPSATASTTSTNGTISNDLLQTWWHSTGEVNTQTPVQPGNVRQSHIYSVQVRTSDSDATFYNSFVYETIPRNGNGNIMIPGDLSSITDMDDGISIEPSIGMTMAWTEFLYSTDVVIKVSRKSGSAVNASSVTIRPSTLDYTIQKSDGDILISVPYSAQGTKFSVEFTDNLYSFHDSCPTSTCGLVQDLLKTGYAYVEDFKSTNPVMAVEPLDSLLIFASPFPAADMIPDVEASTSLVVEPGLVTDLDQTDANTVVFNPGVYWFTGTGHANLSSSVNWVYFAPGAYVKGAVEFTTKTGDMKATGHGVLSGEQYVYQANPDAGYANDGSNTESLRMWRGISSNSEQQTFYLNGVTINAPPFNSMDFTGDMETISVQVSDYKQVGAFFGQTDGLEIYSGSVMTDMFYHSNDDTIKTYYSDVSVQRVVIWKAVTAPVIQFGWASRNISNITVNDISVIHSRWNNNGSHPSIIGSNQIYQDSEAVTNTAVLSNTIKDITYSNIRTEGISGNLFRICPLSNFENFLIENVTIAEFPIATSGISESELVGFTDSSGTAVDITGFVVKGFFVGDTKIDTANGNWDTNGIGNLNIAEEYVNSGGVTII